MARSPFHWFHPADGISGTSNGDDSGQTDDFITTERSMWWRRDVEATVNASSTLLSLAPPTGAWTLTGLSRGSCSDTAQSSVFSGSSVTFKFKGTFVRANIIKDPHGAPYSVTLDGTNTQDFDSFASSRECTSDFEASNLAFAEHTITLVHQGNQTLAASGRSTLYFVSFDYKGTPTIPPVNPPPAGTKSPPTGPIVGGVVGGVAFLFIIVIGFLWFRRRRRVKASRQQKDHEPKETFNPDDHHIHENHHHHPPASVPESYVPHPSIDPYPNQPVNATDTTPFIQNNPNPPRRGKGDDVYYHEEGGRFVRSSPWTSLTSQNQSRGNLASGSSAAGGGPHLVPPGAASSYSGGTQNPAPTSIVSHQYPPAGSSTERSSEPSSYDTPRAHQQPQQPQPLIQQQQQHVASRIYHRAPSEAGESVIIDRSDYIPPPSYSPPMTANHLRQSSTRSKALYDVSRTTPHTTTTPTTKVSPSSNKPYASPGAAENPNLSSTEVDRIARRVVDIMRSEGSTTGRGGGTSSVYSGTTSDVSGVTTATADDPQVQQAVRALLAKEAPHLLASPQPRPDKS
ncbi:hypothetical protein FRC17_005855 [Serendipita sp. 399]|nr:hypothetical protein FRC17_005855 [Serendipita sp. 399]